MLSAVCVRVRHKYSINSTKWADLEHFYARDGFPTLANLSVSPWKYSAKCAVIIAVILFHRTSKCRLPYEQTDTHIQTHTNP